MCSHLYWECRVSQSIIQDFRQHCEQCFGLNLEEFTREVFLLSNFSSALVMTVMVFLKRYLFMCRVQKIQPQFRAFMLCLWSYIRKDKYRAVYVKSTNRFEKFWDVLAYEETLCEFDLI